MAVTFIHTADWQLGKPFGGIDADKSPLVRQKRIDSLTAIANLVRDRNAKFVVVAGDIFDSFHPTKNVVSAACQAIAAMKVPVYVIPGNHDHGGKGGPFDQDYFREEAAKLAPNLVVLLESKPVVRDDCAIFPCPLMHRHETGDPTLWLRSSPNAEEVGDRPRIVLAHGSIQGFGQQESDTDDEFTAAPNLLNLGMLPGNEYDYLALGDWHGCREAGLGGKAWYSGTHETDRFPKGDDYASGHVLVVKAARGVAPVVEKVATGQSLWKRLSIEIADDSTIANIIPQVTDLFPKGFAGHMLHLSLSGPVSLKGEANLNQVLETLSARLLFLKLQNSVSPAPSEEELAQLTDRSRNPLLGKVAARLREMETGPDAVKAKLALRELYRLTLR